MLELLNKDLLWDYWLEYAYDVSIYYAYFTKLKDLWTYKGD